MNPRKYSGLKRWNYIQNQRQRGISDEIIARKLGIKLESMRVWLSRNKSKYEQNQSNFGNSEKTPEIDEIIKEKLLLVDNSENQDYFLDTVFGQEFEDKYNDLTQSIISLIVIPEIMKNTKLFKEGFTKDTLFENLQALINQADLSEEEDEQAVSLVEEIEGLWDTGMVKLEELMSLTSKREEVIENSSVEETDQLDDDKDWIENLDVLNITDRMNGYFVLSLYAYLEMYVMSLIQAVLSKLEPGDIYSGLREFRYTNNPMDGIKGVIKLLGDQAKQDFTHLIKQDSYYQNYKDAFEKLHEIRNKVAHKQPIASYNELMNTFPYLQKSLKEMIAEMNTSYQDIGLPLADDLFKGMVNSIGPAMILVELSKFCLKYLIIVESFVTSRSAISIDNH